MSDLLSMKDVWIDAIQDGKRGTIVKGVSVSVTRGEVCALIGESGAGKSTLALAAMGYTRGGCRFARGKVTFDGIDVFAMSATQKRALRGHRIAYVAQSAAAAFNPALTIDDQVMEAAAIHGIPVKDRIAPSKIYESLDLPNPETIGRRYPHQVSGGQLQRFMIAMALSCGPDLVILDEPTTALDVTTQVEVLVTLKRAIRERSTAAIYVTHDLSVVAQVADRIAVLYRGELIEEGVTERIIAQPCADYTRRLMAAAVPKRKSSDQVEAIISSRLPNRIEATQITAGYGPSVTVPVLRDVEVAVPRGKVVAIVGESGSGKSTLARVLAGLLPPRSGSTCLDGDTLPDTISRRSREELRKVQLVFQSPDVSLNPKQTVGQIIGRPLVFYGRCRRRNVNDRIAELLELVGLPREFAGRVPAELSGGQRQRVSIARALAADPEVMLCDEITASLDRLVGAAILDLLMKVQARFGLSLLYISHDLSLVSAIADEVYVLYSGRVVEHGSAEEVFRNPRHPYTKLLLRSVPQLSSGWLENHTANATIMEPDAASASGDGCAFFPRCVERILGRCNLNVPELRPTESGHKVACYQVPDYLGADLKGAATGTNGETKPSVFDHHRSSASLLL